MKRLGVVVGTPKVDEFNFGAKVNGDIRKGQLVETTANGKNRIISQIKEIMAVNEYFGNGTVRQHLNRKDMSTFLDNTVLLATATPLAMITDKEDINPPDIPVTPGSEIFSVLDGRTAKRVFGFVDRGINLGAVMYNDAIQVNLDPNSLIPTHVAMLAQTGGGKTYAVLVMLEEFLEKSLAVWDEVLKYLFRWDNIPGNDSERLLRFFMDDLDIGWAGNAEIRKSADGKTIRIFKDENSAEIIIDKKKEKATLKISNNGTYDLWVKEENGKLNIYVSMKKKSQMHFLIIDPHGEYRKILDSAKKIHKEDKISLFRGPFTIPVNEIPAGLPSFIKEISPEITDPQLRLLEDSWNKVSENKPVTINELKISIRRSSGAKQTRGILLQILEKFVRYKLIGDEGSIDLLKNIAWNDFLILDFSSVTSYIQQIYLRYALKKVFDSRTEGRIPPICIVIEEIHNFAPSTKSSESAITRGMIRNISREGRKFGVGLCITSQRPSMIDTTVISQCGTIIALRTTNENDLKSISAIAEGMDADMLRKLPPGVALIAGRAVNYPVYAKIRHRMVKEEKEGAFFEEKKVFRIDKSGQSRFFLE